MAKGFKGDVSLGRKVPLKKKELAIDTVEEQVQKIHQETKTKDEGSKRASLKLPKSVYRQMKRRVVELDITVQDYLKNLVLDDLHKSGDSKH